MPLLDPNRRRELTKGILCSLPVLLVLAVFTVSMDAISQWGAERDYDWAGFQSLLVILFWSTAIGLVGLVSAVIRFWGRARWVAYGILASFAAIVVLGAGWFLWLLTGIPGHD
jgi:hypothetical protein